ncbi:MAG: 30S ribosomal protein S1 [Gammaproteobacteria bacterium]|nr:30S ribosomal protein S1 [Pseudomonadota bacterium]MCH9662447.1 30S ribosomal protein S1 [Gammaproteobacteria bacterium]
MSESFAQLFEGSQSKFNVEIGAVIGVSVLEVRDDCVVLDTRLKSECFLPLSQFSDREGKIGVEAGDMVDVVLDAFEDGHGVTRVSREKALLTECWKKVISSYNNNEIIEGFVTKRIRGGLQVLIDNLITAFLPGSLVDIGFVRDNSFLENTTVEFKIIKIDPEKDNVVVSRRAALEQIHGVSYEKTIEKIKPGDVVEGLVKNFTDYGVFVNIGGVDGLLHITDVSWHRIARPSEVLSPNQKINVVILSVDREKNRISLGYKQLQENPWLKLAEKFTIGQQVEGRVTSVTEFGCFVELLPGCEGLVHVSEMDWKNKNPSPHKFAKSNDMVKVQVLDVDKQRCRISLGMRQCVENPWEKFARTHQKGDRIQGIMRSTTDFGVFIELDLGINGLLHINDLSWVKPSQQSFSEFLEAHKKGDALEVIVLEIHPQNQKVYLGYKNEPDTPFREFFEKHPRNSVINAAVLNVGSPHTLVQLPGGIKGFLPTTEVREESVRAIYPDISPGTELDFLVDNMDRKLKMVRLHLKRLLDKETKQALHEIRADQVSSGASLGEIATTRDAGDKKSMTFSEAGNRLASSTSTEASDAQSPAADKAESVDKSDQKPPSDDTPNSAGA